MRIGIDVDGVLADFNTAYMRLCVQVAGVDRFGEGFIIREWNYPETQAGYDHALVTDVWNRIKQDRNFWAKLDAYPTTVEALDLANTLRAHAHDVYFITSRVGYRAKEQTEFWLRAHGMPSSTVLLSHDKGAAAVALNLTHYIDDKAENVMSVCVMAPTCHTSLLTQTWNAPFVLPGISRVDSCAAFLRDLGPRL